MHEELKIEEEVTPLLHTCVSKEQYRISIYGSWSQYKKPAVCVGPSCVAAEQIEPGSREHNLHGAWMTSEVKDEIDFGEHLIFKRKSRYDSFLAHYFDQVRMLHGQTTWVKSLKDVSTTWVQSKRDCYSARSFLTKVALPWFW